MTSMKKLLALAGATVLILGCWSCDDETTTSAPALVGKPGWVSVWVQNTGPSTWPPPQALALPEDPLPEPAPGPDGVWNTCDDVGPVNWGPDCVLGTADDYANAPSPLSLWEVNLYPRSFTFHKKGGGDYVVRVAVGTSVITLTQLVENETMPDPLRMVGSYGVPPAEYEAVSAEFGVRNLVAEVVRRFNLSGQPIVTKDWICAIPSGQATLSVSRQTISGGLDLREGAAGAIVFNIPLQSWQWCLEQLDGGIGIGSITATVKTD